VLGASEYEEEGCTVRLSALIVVVVACFSVSVSGQTVLQPPGAVNGEQIGTSVAIEGDLAVIGAYNGTGTAPNQGSASAYQWDGSAWQFVETLISPTPALSSQYGFDVSLSGGTLAVGEWLNDTGVTNAGAVHIYTWSGTGWVFQQTVQASVPASNDSYGFSVALDGDTLAVCATEDSFSQGAIYIYRRSGGVWFETQKLTSSDGGIGHRFGADVDIDGNYLVSGAPGADGLVAGTGAAYIFKRTSLGAAFIEQTKIFADDGTVNDAFGISVAITSESIVLIGDPLDDTQGINTGAAYIFTRTSSVWTQKQKLIAADAAGLGFKDFGQSVALSVDSAIIGAPRNQGTGSVYIFAHDGGVWVEDIRYDAPPGASGAGQFGTGVDIWGNRAIAGGPQFFYNGNGAGLAAIYEPVGRPYSGPGQQIAPGTLDPYAQFGYAVDIDGDYAVVGAIGGNTPYGTPGDVYVLFWDGVSWVVQDHLQPFDGELFDQFGSSVAISGDTIAVGSKFDDDVFQTSGSVYVYTRTGTVWSLQQKLTASDPGQFDKLGTDVAIDGDTIIAGAPEDDDQASNAGAAYVFVRSLGVWTQQAKVDPASVFTANDKFGTSVGISGDTVIVGSPNNDALGFSNSGTAYVFTRTAGVWTLQEQFLASDMNHLSFVGTDVDVDGEYAIVGTNPGINVDTAYILHRVAGVWSEEALLTSGGALPHIGFARSVSISGIFALVGASAGAEGGVSYLFTRSGSSWTAGPIIQPSNVIFGDSFGRDVAIGGNKYIMGAPFDDTLQGVNAGTTVQVVIPLPTPDLTGDAVVNGADLGLLLSAWTGTRIAGADLNLDGKIDGADLGLMLGSWGPI
jgi:FG-GAP repeat protein